MKERLIAWTMNTVVMLLALSIPFGIGMAFYTDNSQWLVFCLPILIFLS